MKKSLLPDFHLVTPAEAGASLPKPDLGRLIASLLMPTGLGTKVVPAEFAARRAHPTTTTRTCHECQSEGHRALAKFCADCDNASLCRSLQPERNVLRTLPSGKIQFQFSQRDPKWPKFTVI